VVGAMRLFRNFARSTPSTFKRFSVRDSACSHVRMWVCCTNKSAGVAPPDPQAVSWRRTPRSHGTRLQRCIADSIALRRWYFAHFFQAGRPTR
jgi:hypothetical protein